MKIYFVRCMKCGALLGTVQEEKDITKSKCFWAIQAIGGNSPDWKGVRSIKCANCKTKHSVYTTNSKPFVIRRKSS